VGTSQPVDRQSPRAGPVPGQRLRGADAFRLHLTLTIGLIICVGAFVIEVIRALDGNSLSWAYVFEWPILGSFAIYMWWNLLHGHDGRRRKPATPTIGPDGRPRTPVPGGSAVTPPPPGATSVDRGTAPGPGTAGPEVDPDLAAWQAYVADMEAEERRQAGGD
jgi:hypothetical protein